MLNRLQNYGHSLDSAIPKICEIDTPDNLLLYLKLVKRVLFRTFAEINSKS